MSCVVNKLYVTEFRGDLGTPLNTPIAEDDNCPITINPLRNYKLLSQTHCEHLFSTKAILEVIQRQVEGAIPHSCPSCRQNPLPIRHFVRADIEGIEDQEIIDKRELEPVPAAPAAPVEQVVPAVAEPKEGEILQPGQPVQYRLLVESNRIENTALETFVRTPVFRSIAIVFNCIHWGLHGVIHASAWLIKKVFEVAEVIIMLVGGLIGLVMTAAVSLALSPVSVPVAACFTESWEEFTEWVAYAGVIPVAAAFIIPAGLLYGTKKVMDLGVDFFDMKAPKHTPETIWNHGLAGSIRVKEIENMLEVDAIRENVVD